MICCSRNKIASGVLTADQQKEQSFGCSAERSGSMCDYSLESVASRPAKIGDRLVTTSFNGTLTHGFAAIREPNVAVCLLPGTEVAFDKEVKERGFWLSKSTGQNTAIFRQFNKNIPGIFHDALEFPDGQIVLVARLKKGQCATVLQLPAIPTAGHGAKQEERTSVLA
jgi:hypothetical protein